MPSSNWSRGRPRSLKLRLEFQLGGVLSASRLGSAKAAALNAHSKAVSSVRE